MSEYSEYPVFDPDSEDVINREVVDHESPATMNSVARRAALQALYEIDSSAHPIGTVLSGDLLFAIKENRAKRFMERIVRDVVATRHEIDLILQNYAPEWPINQISIIDRNILRIAMFELVNEPQTPPGVVIDEAIALSQLFGSDGTTRFVNGVLGTVVTNLDAIRETLKIKASDQNDPSSQA